MMLEMLRQDGAVATFVGENKSVLETREFVERYSPDLICLTCSTAECTASATALIRDLKAALPPLTVIAGGNAAVAATSEFLSAGCLQVFRSGREARRAIRGLTLGRSTRRSEFDQQRSDALGHQEPPAILPYDLKQIKSPSLDPPRRTLGAPACHGGGPTRSSSGRN